MDFKEFKEKYQKAEVTAYPNRVPNNPVVSILVQTYNHEAFLQQCLDAILAQHTTFEFEVLLGEDASSDRTREICLKYAEAFPEKIRLFLHHSANKIRILDHPSGNFNAFFNFYHARGDYIAFCEGDDYWTDPQKLQKQVNFLKRNVDFAFSYHLFEESHEASGNRKNQKSLDQPTKDLEQHELAKINFHPLLSTICFRNSFRELPEEIVKVINVDSFLLSLLGELGKAKFQANIKASVYRRHSGGEWTGKKKSLKLQVKINTYTFLATYYDKQNNKELYSYFNIVKKNYTKMLFLHHLKNLQVLKAIQMVPALF